MQADFARFHFGFQGSSFQAAGAICFFVCGAHFPVAAQRQMYSIEKRPPIGAFRIAMYLYPVQSIDSCGALSQLAKKILLASVVTLLVGIAATAANSAANPSATPSAVTPSAVTPSAVPAAQEAQGEIIGTIEGQAIAVKGPMSVQVVGNEVKTLLRSGVDIRVKLGRARTILTGGGTIAICGPAHISLLKAGNALTVALDTGTIHAHVTGNLALNIFTSQILAKTVAIGDGA